MFNPKFPPLVSHFSSAFHPYLNFARALWIIDFLVHCLKQETEKKKLCWPKPECFVHWTKCFLNSKWSILFSELFLPPFFVGFFFLFFKLWSLNTTLKWYLKRKKKLKIKHFVLNIPKGKFCIVIFSDYLGFCNLLALFVCLRGRAKRADCQNESSCLADNYKLFKLILKFLLSLFFLTQHPSLELEPAAVEHLLKDVAPAEPSVLVRQPVHPVPR